MSSMPRDALNTSASKPGAIGVPSSRLRALARLTTSCGSEMSAGVILFITSTAAYPSMRSAPTLKIWMTPFASVAMLEKLALLKIALCSAPVPSPSAACMGHLSPFVAEYTGYRRRHGIRCNMLLLVEDSASVSSIAAMLEGADCDLVVVTSGAEALRVLGEREVAVCVVALDDTLGATAQISADARARNVPIVVVTNAEIESAPEVVDVIRRPIEASILRAKRSVFEAGQRHRVRAVGRLQAELLATLGQELRPPLHAIVGWERKLRDGSLREPPRTRPLETVARRAQAADRPSPRAERRCVDTNGGSRHRVAAQRRFKRRARYHRYRCKQRRGRGAARVRRFRDRSPPCRAARWNPRDRGSDVGGRPSVRRHVAGGRTTPTHRRRSALVPLAALLGLDHGGPQKVGKNLARTARGGQRCEGAAARPHGVAQVLRQDRL